MCPRKLSYFILDMTSIRILFLFLVAILYLAQSTTGLDNSRIVKIKVANDDDYYDFRRPSKRQDRRNSGKVNSRGEDSLVTNKCLRCLCHASTGCKNVECVNSGPDSYFCGPFQTSWAYWSEAGKPTVPGGDGNFEECLTDYNCSARAVTSYMKKHQQDCNNDQVVDCYDLAKIHKAGPYSCDAAWVEKQGYWTKFQQCMNNEVSVRVPSKLAKSPSSSNKNPPREDVIPAAVHNPRKPVIVATSGRLVDDKCLECLCQANSGCQPKNCTGASNICGPFQATWNYWHDGGEPTVPGGLSRDHPHAFEQCLKDRECSSRIVEGYMNKYQKDCDGNYVIDCYDFAKIHKGGPGSCPTKYLESHDYWKRFEKCMRSDAPVRPFASSGYQQLSNRNDHEDKAPSRQTKVEVSSQRNAKIDDKCLKCICYASSKCEAKGCVNAGPKSYFCGPFQANWDYWSVGGKPTVVGGLPAGHKHSFEECLKDYTCSSKAVTGYMNKHSQDCNKDGVRNCYDYARIHKLGPTTCGGSSLEKQAYWTQFLDCMNDRVTVSLPGEKPDITSTYNDGDDIGSFVNWQEPQEAGPYEPPATVRPASNARLPPFASQQQYNRPKQQQSYDEPQQNQQSYGRPQRDQQTYGRPQKNQESYGGPENNQPSYDQVERQPQPNNRVTSTSEERRRRPVVDSGIDLVSDKCLQCVCYASSECQSVACHDDGSSSSFCGPFLISEAYWKAAGAPNIPDNYDSGFEECVQDYQCSLATVQGYMREHQRDCNQDRQINCYDYARIHKLGNVGCNQTSIENSKYWERLVDCMEGYVTFE